MSFITTERSSLNFARTQSWTTPVLKTAFICFIGGKQTCTNFLQKVYLDEIWWNLTDKHTAVDPPAVTWLQHRVRASLVIL